MVPPLRLWLLLAALSHPGCSLLVDRACSEGRPFCPGGTVCQAGRCVASPADADGDTDGDADTDGDTDGDGDAEWDADFEADYDCGLAAPGCWVRVPAGIFEMGSPEEELSRDEGLETRHQVSLTRDFFLLSTEVTQADYEAATGLSPSYHPPEGTDYDASQHPVEQVAWDDAARFCNALSRAAGLGECYSCGESTCSFARETWTTVYNCPGYRLPTEAEWEYAARAGDGRATYNGELTGASGESCGSSDGSPVLDPIAWWCGNALFPEARSIASHPVGLRWANAFGLFDMLGNVQEWVHDSYGDYGSDYPVLDEPRLDPVAEEGTAIHMVRGGDYNSPAANCRVARRSWDNGDDREAYRGFRVARTAR